MSASLATEPMAVLVLGATGATGRLVVDAAIADGHRVTALVRDPHRLEPRPRLTIVTGDATDVDTLAEAMTGVDAVISALGRGLATGATTLIEDATTALVAATARTGVRRVVFLSSFGVGESRRRASWVARLLYRGPARHVYRDKARGEVLLRKSALDWTLLYPVNLVDAEPRGRVSTIDLESVARPPGTGLLPRISRGDVARTIVDAIRGTDWIRRTIVLT